MDLKKVLFAAAGAMVGKIATERFVLKATPDDPTGFVLVQDGIGVDDLVSALGAVFGIAGVKMLMRRG